MLFDPVPSDRCRHVCGFFQSKTVEYAALMPFICDGIQCGCRAYHVVAEQNKADRVTQLREFLDVESLTRTQQLQISCIEEPIDPSGVSINMPCWRPYGACLRAAGTVVFL
jgi:hypothetical protein